MTSPVSRPWISCCWAASWSVSGDHAVSAARRVVYIVSGFDPTKEPTRDEGTDID